MTLALFFFPEVLGVASRGDGDAARLRRQAIATVPVMEVGDEVETLTRRILAAGLIPGRARAAREGRTVRRRAAFRNAKKSGSSQGTVNLRPGRGVFLRKGVKP